MKYFRYSFFLFLPIIAIAVWYSPVVFKGHSPLTMAEQIVLGKNIANTGIYAIESGLNVFLSSGLIKEEGHESFLGNKLTGHLYAFVFKTIGFLDWNDLILFSATLNAVTLLLFAFSALILFDFKTSVVFSLIYIFLPFNWWRTHVVGGYEFALLFLSLFFLFYFLGSDRKKYGPFLFIISGVFLALAGMARETLFLIIPLLFVYLLWMKRRQEIILVFVPLLIVISIAYLPDFLSGRNNYLQGFPKIETPKSESNDFIFYGEFYPDPYTYHFDKESFLNDYAKRRDSQDLISSLYAQKLAVNNVEADHMTFARRILLGFLLMINHLGRFVSWEDIGGPIIFALMLLGLYYLRKNRQPLFRLFICLILGIVFLLSFFFLFSRSHLTDFGWILALLVALGLLLLVSVAEAYFKLDKKKTFFVFSFVLAMVLYNLFLSGRTYWGRAYDSKQNLRTLAYASKIDKLNISNKDVIALWNDDQFLAALSLNYLTDKSIVIFNPDTIKKLLKNDKINSAFETFGVKYIVGYPEKMSGEIISKTGVINISSDNIELEIHETSFLKSWLMYLIK